MMSNIRRALFEVLMVLTVEHDNTVVIDNGEDVSYRCIASSVG